MTLPPDMERPPDHDERMRVMRRLAKWELGDSARADVLIAGYLYPQAVSEQLDHEEELIGREGSEHT